MTDRFNPFAAYPQAEHAHRARPWWELRTSFAFAAIGGVNRRMPANLKTADGFFSLSTERPWYWHRGDGHVLASRQTSAPLSTYIVFTESTFLADLLRCDAEALAAYDTAHPMAAPPPAATQVWHFRWREVEPPEIPDFYSARDVVLVAVDYHGRTDEPRNPIESGALVWSSPLRDPSTGETDRIWPGGIESWPPAGAILLHGPGAPWAPPGWTVPSAKASDAEAAAEGEETTP